MLCELVFVGSVMLRDMKTDEENASWWANARIMLKQDEGIRYYPYRDTEGHWTIGVGRNLEATPLSITVIRMMLDEDIQKAITSACSIFSPKVFDSWSPARQHAVVNMVFNLGEGGFRGFKNMIAAIKRDDWIEAANEAMKSKWAKQVGSRADRIVQLMVNEKYHYVGI